MADLDEPAIEPDVEEVVVFCNVGERLVMEALNILIRQRLRRIADVVVDHQRAVHLIEGP